MSKHGIHVSVKYEVRSWQGKRIFPFLTKSRPALVSAQPSSQWTPSPLSLQVKWSQHETDESPHSSAKIKNAWIFTSNWIYFMCFIQIPS